MHAYLGFPICQLDNYLVSKNKYLQNIPFISVCGVGRWILLTSQPFLKYIVHVVSTYIVFVLYLLTLRLTIKIHN